MASRASARPTGAASFSFVFLDSVPFGPDCGTLGTAGYMAKTEAHEIIHNLGR